jgi:hypothetical protein
MMDALEESKLQINVRIYIIGGLFIFMLKASEKPCQVYRKALYKFDDLE